MSAFQADLAAFHQQLQAAVQGGLPSPRVMPLYVPTASEKQQYQEAVRVACAPRKAKASCPVAEAKAFCPVAEAETDALLPASAETDGSPPGKSHIPRVYFFRADDLPGKAGRRRKVAYVWIDQGDRGVVFYGASVYNPHITLDRLVKHYRTSATLHEAATQRARPPPYHGSQETQTALSRLKIRPVIFETTARSHMEVREEVRRNVFQLGAVGPRVKNWVEPEAANRPETADRLEAGTTDRLEAGRLPTVAPSATGGPAAR